MPELLHKALTQTLIGIYYDVYNGTGRTYPERFYDTAMVHDLRQARVACIQQPEYRILHKEKIVGKQILDILIAGEVVVENKVAPALTRLHKAQLLSYLKVTDKSVGLLFNFGGPKPEFQRLYFTPREPKIAKASAERAAADPALEGLIAPELVYEVVGGLFAVHTALGPGFIHRIYANACHHELKLRGLPVQPLREMQVFYKDTRLGELKFGHLRVGETLMVFPAAIQSLADLHLENFREWMRAQQVPLGLLVNFHDIELKPLFIKVQ